MSLFQRRMKTFYLFNSLSALHIPLKGEINRKNPVRFEVLTRWLSRLMHVPCILLGYSALKMEATSTSEIIVNIYQATCHLTPNDKNLRATCSIWKPAWLMYKWNLAHTQYVRMIDWPFIPWNTCGHRHHNNSYLLLWTSELSIPFIPHFIIRSACGLLPSDCSIPPDVNNYKSETHPLLCRSGPCSLHPFFMIIFWEFLTGCRFVIVLKEFATVLYPEAGVLVLWTSAIWHSVVW